MRPAMLLATPLTPSGLSLLACPRFLCSGVHMSTVRGRRGELQLESALGSQEGGKKDPCEGLGTEAGVA